MRSAIRLIFILLLPIRLVAQIDFVVDSPEGHQLPFRILRDSCSVELTHPETEWPYFKSENQPIGTLTLPATITHRGRNYQVVSIGSNALYGCRNLTALHCPSVVRIGSQALNGCTALETIELGDHLQSIAEGAFAYCHSLRDLRLPASLEHIGISAFACCEGLRQVAMTPETFARCNALTFHLSPLMNDPKNRKTTPSGLLFWSLDDQ